MQRLDFKAVKSLFVDMNILSINVLNVNLIIIQWMNELIFCEYLKLHKYTFTQVYILRYLGVSYGVNAGSYPLKTIVPNGGRLFNP